MVLKWFVIVLLAQAGYGAARKIPDYIHICKRTDPQVAKCVRQSVEALRPRLKTGIPELGVPGLEPLHIREIVIIPPGSQNNFKATLNNIEVSGAGDFQITKIKLNIDKLTYHVGIKLPALTMNGEYDVNARILVVPVKGNGKFHSNATDCEGHAVLRGELVTKDGHRILKWTTFDFNIKIGDYNIQLENLFGGDQTLSQAVNEIVNQNKRELIDAATPYIQRKAAEILLEAANKITDNFDYDEVFPEK